MACARKDAFEEEGFYFFWEGQALCCRWVGSEPAGRELAAAKEIARIHLGLW